jgi:propionyl-CoA carboxylase alpha chain/3-methylcrotonyl-CoA carboxylase alpha subunit/acetyl-CoA/propionyl-CoA carboxylase biotin carboxyl carrier protein
VGLADEAVQLEGQVPTGAYLDQQQIIAACKKTGAEAVHPGYGFLSENAKFAEAVEAAGLTFIGPDPAVMRLMGDKIASREFAAKHGIPVAPSAMQTGSVDAFVAAARKIGFPLLIKASAGGGGKGMKIVRREEELAENIRVAASEAQRYFSDGRVYAERLVEGPRHIEVQVLGDGKGNVVHLFERECSIQRRYQKVVEESPAPNLPVKLRDEICAAAVRLTSAAKYKNAGTVEFILGASGEFYFLEMNTRLQVEHPVTEIVLGLDLVAEQLKIAAGEGLTVAQSELKQSGHAIEVRICAERPERDFQPATGRVGLLRVPTGPGVRWDGGIREGQAVTPAFDSMLAKLITNGATRAEAIDRMAGALKELVILGVPTNVDFLRRIMANPTFRSGTLDTGFIAREAASLAPPAPPAGEEAAAILAALSGNVDFRLAAYEVPEPYASIGAWHN